jgi:hypothetical protein
MKGWDLLADNRILRSFVYIDLGPVSIVLGYIRIGENGFNRAFRNARVAIDTGVGVDIKTVRQFMKSFNRTNGCAVGVLAIDA